MLLIPCPWCGPRDETEFHCAGQAEITRPASTLESSDRAWGGYLFDRDNPKGLHRERWLHRHGCRQWFILLRDTTNHRIEVPESPGTVAVMDAPLHRSAE